MAVASARVDAKTYTFFKLPLPKETHIEAVAVGLENANAILPSQLFLDPMLPLVAILAIFKSTLDSNSVVPYNKEQIAEVGDYLAEWLAAMDMLVDKSMHTVVVLYNAILCSKRDRQSGPGKTALFDITHGLAYKVLLTKC